MLKQACRPAVALGLALLLSVVAGPVSAQKHGGILKSQQRSNPPSLSTHESSTFNTNWPMSPVYNNVVFFDPFKPVEALETVIPELAESWNWDATHTRLTFKVRQGVKWHDGKPFTANDIKHTFDVVRGVGKDKPKLNPRRLWYKNVKEITTNGDREVTFVLERPQPALLMLLASGYSPVYPAHVSMADLRLKAVGTGPFTLTEYVRDRVIKVRKNPGYWRKDRPYLDGIDFIVISKKSTALSALQAGQIDVLMPTETDQKVYMRLKDVPGLEFIRLPLAGHHVHVIVNNRKPPFNEPKLRRAVSMAMDREAYTRAIQPGYQAGGFLMGPPDGEWGLSLAELKEVPGYRDAEVDKEDARKLMRELGYGDNKRLQVKITTRTPANYVDAATWLLGELRQIYIDAELEVVDDGQWYPRQARRDYTISLSAMGYGVDDPDVVYFEGFTCGSQRNYTDYCDPVAEKMFAEQSATVDPAARKALVKKIERKLIDDVAKASLAFRVDYHARWNFVKNLVPHNTGYSWARMENVWLDK